jgi:hypothetical protein
MKQSRRIESTQFAVKTGKNGKPVIVDLHDKNKRIVCGFSCFMLAYQQAKKLNNGR